MKGQFDPFNFDKCDAYDFDTGKLCGHKTDRGFNQSTASGRPFYCGDPQPEDIRIYDIAAQLARICRFGGALRDDIDHYSVAQHSVLVSRHVPQGFELEGLLHDAAEAYIGDMIKPVKIAYLVDSRWRTLEWRLDRVIRAKYGLKKNVSPEVKQADYFAVATEHRDIQATNQGVDWGPLPEPWPDKIHPVGSRLARAMFLDRFNELTGGVFA